MKKYLFHFIYQFNKQLISVFTECPVQSPLWNVPWLMSDLVFCNEGVGDLDSWHPHKVITASKWAVTSVINSVYARCFLTDRPQKLVLRCCLYTVYNCQPHSAIIDRQSWNLQSQDNKSVTNEELSTWRFAVKLGMKMNILPQRESNLF